MINCPKCSAQLEDGSKFCNQCGSQIYPAIDCAVCGNKTSAEFAFCQSCGASLRSAPAAEPAPVPEPVLTPEPEVPLAPKSAPESAPEPAAEAPPVAAPMAEAEARPEYDESPAPVQEAAPSFPPQNSALEKTPALEKAPVAGKMPFFGKKPAAGQPPVGAADGAAAQKGMDRRTLVLLAGGVTVVALAILLVVSLMMGGGGKTIFFLKDSQLHYTPLSKIDPVEVTSDLGSNLSEYDAYYLSGHIKTSEDQRYLFYPDRVSGSFYNASYTLYYRDLRNSRQTEDSAVKVTSDVTSYQINVAGNRLYYIKGSTNNLYYSNMKDSEKIDGEVSWFVINDAGNKVFYFTEDNVIYTKTAGKDKEKIDTVSRVVKISEDLKSVYYVKDDTLYLKVEGKEKEKIASDVGDFVQVYDSGEVYFTRNETEQIKLSTFVDDYLKAQDEELVRPELDGYAEWDDYYLDYRDYEAKLTRDSLRQALDRETVTVGNNTLYYCNGKGDTVAVADSVRYVEGMSQDKAVLVYSRFNRAEVARIRIDEIGSYQDVRSLVDAAFSSSADYYAAVGAAESYIEQTKAGNFQINGSATAIYFIDDFAPSGDAGDLYEAKISGSTVETPTRYAEDVFSYYMFREGSNDLVFFRDVNDYYAGDLYLNNTLVDSDVYYSAVQFIEDTADLTYFVDWNYSSSVGTLKTYTGGKAVKVADDVHSYEAFGKNAVAYLVDYNTSRGRGDAYLYTGASKPEKLADDVVAILPIH